VILATRLYHLISLPAFHTRLRHAPIGSSVTQDVVPYGFLGFLLRGCRVLEPGDGWTLGPPPGTLLTKVFREWGLGLDLWKSYQVRLDKSVYVYPSRSQLVMSGSSIC
jgi:hypothetical protein